MRRRRHDASAIQSRRRRRDAASSRRRRDWPRSPAPIWRRARPGRSSAAPDAEAAKASEPFWGAHQGGVVTPAQTHTYIAVFDLTTAKRADVEKLLRQWTEAAAALSEGRPVEIPGEGDYAAQADPVRRARTCRRRG